MRFAALTADLRRSLQSGVVGFSRLVVRNLFPVSFRAHPALGCVYCCPRVCPFASLCVFLCIYLIYVTRLAWICELRKTATWDYVPSVLQLVSQSWDHSMSRNSSANEILSQEHWHRFWTFHALGLHRHQQQRSTLPLSAFPLPQNATSHHCSSPGCVGPIA